jgi:hypothetical protein
MPLGYILRSVAGIKVIAVPPSGRRHGGIHVGGAAGAFYVGPWWLGVAGFRGVFWTLRCLWSPWVGDQKHTRLPHHSVRLDRITDVRVWALGTPDVSEERNATLQNARQILAVGGSKEECTEGYVRHVVKGLQLDFPAEVPLFLQISRVDPGAA